MKFDKRRGNTKPEIPTASMPDIVFMLLLFFMVTTTLRDVNVLVDYKLPEAESLEKIENKRLVSYLWVGKEKNIQVNDSVIKLDELKDIMYSKRQSMQGIIVSLRIDRNVDMGLVTDIQQELRKAYCLRINYSSTQKY
ncbi:MAG: biopolymer transporter ExbD [Ignavibacteriaceae bacterium]|nr:biopolymer transporter ExbD [Ignavibacteriaceae bacterium]